jgi:hypothetical protein
MGIHEDIEGKGKKRSVTRQTSWVVSPINQTGCVVDLDKK